MIVELAYGDSALAVDLPDSKTTVLQPTHTPGLPDERRAIENALQNPIQSPPLKQRIHPSHRLCILFTDITRATPNERLIPWLLHHLKDHPRENITLLNQLGTHRPNTHEELCQMLTPEIVRNYRVINHNCEDPNSLLQLGHTRDGTPALIHKLAIQADLRIVTGFIEPHFFAGFSGGPKGIMPGVAGLQTIMSNHGEKNIRHPKATFGITHGNPLWEELRDIALRAGPSFLLNVALNETRQITATFAGDLIQAHQQGCQFVKQSAMQPVPAPFDIVLTTNSGYPLDLNLYQGVKGMSAGARILKNRGLLILACECREGIPPDSPLDKLLQSTRSPEEILAKLATPGFQKPEQWQAQIQALIQRRAEIQVHSSLDPQILQNAHLKPCPDIAHTVRQHLRQLGPQARIAALPQGPLTIPYIESN